VGSLADGEGIIACRNPAPIEIAGEGPLVRVMATPADANPNGDIFGGWLLAQMDRAGGSLAVPSPRAAADERSPDGKAAYSAGSGLFHHLQQFGHDIRHARLMLDLLEGALSGGLIGAPAQKHGAMPEAIAGDLIVAHFDDHLRPQWLPFGGALGVPSARTSRCRTGEAGRQDQPLQPLCQRLPIEMMECRGKADVIEPALIVIEPEQQGPDLPRAARNPPTTRSAERCRFTFSIARSPGR
jgi:hypothetical protein